MWRTLRLEDDGTLRGEDGALVRFRDPKEVARAAARSRDRPVLETRLRTGERVALAFEPGRAHLIPLPQRDDLDVERLAKVVSHDVRAPLRAIEAYATFLAEDAGTLSESAEEDLGRLRSATARLRKHLDGLVDFLRAPATPAGATCRARDVAARLVARFEGAFAARGGSIRLEAAEGAAGARLGVSEAALDEQLARLLENVLDHVPRERAPHARVSVSARQGGGVRIEVGDDGPGLAAPDRERVLELFRRGGARKEGDDHAGAGLAIVKRAVEAWGGELALDEAPEGGLVVRIDLPATPEAIDLEPARRV